MDPLYSDRRQLYGGEEGDQESIPAVRQCGAQDGRRCVWLAVSQDRRGDHGRGFCEACDGV